MLILKILQKMLFETINPFHEKPLYKKDNLFKLKTILFYFSLSTYSHF